MRERLTLCVVVVFVLAALGTAQTRPDFSGAWKFLGTPPPVPPAPPATAGDPPPPPPPPRTLALTIAQSATELKVDRLVEMDGRRSTHTFTYNLDGSESTNEMGAMLFRTRAAWKDGGLVLTSRVSDKSSPDTPVGELIDVYRIVKGDLVIDTTRQQASGEVAISKSTFRKGK